MTPPDVSDDVTRSESDRARRTVRSPLDRPDRARNRSVGIILTGLIVAVSMSSIDQTIVSLSSQTIQTGLSLDSRGIEWIVNSYLLAAAALFPVAGKLADVLGYKRMMLAGTIAFAIGGLLCGLTPQGSLALAWMIVSRVVQGAGLALMFPSAIGILFSHAPEEKRAKYMAMFFAITGGMTAIGPIAGSYLITFSWRAVFFINLPLAIAAVSLIWALTPADGNTGLAAGLASMDWPGAVLVALAMASLIIPLQQGGTVGWTDVRIIGGLLCSVILFLAFGIHESRTTRPIITIGVFRSARFSLSALATLAASMAFIPVMYFVSVYGELALDQNVLHASEFILYFFIGFMVAAQIGARIFDAHGIRRVLLVAGLLSIIGFGRLHAIAGGLDAGVPPVSALTVPLMLSGAGIGMMFSPAATDMVNRALNASYGEVTAITQMIKNFGGAEPQSCGTAGPQRGAIGRCHGLTPVFGGGLRERPPPDAARCGPAGRDVRRMADPMESADPPGEKARKERAVDEDISAMDAVPGPPSTMPRRSMRGRWNGYLIISTPLIALLIVTSGSAAVSSRIVAACLVAVPSVMFLVSVSPRTREVSNERFMTSKSGAWGWIFAGLTAASQLAAYCLEHQAMFAQVFLIPELFIAFTYGSAMWLITTMNIGLVAISIAQVWPPTTVTVMNAIAQSGGSILFSAMIGGAIDQIVQVSNHNQHLVTQLLDRRDRSGH